MLLLIRRNVGILVGLLGLLVSRRSIIAQRCHVDLLEPVKLLKT
jgi:hypothetical protein